MLVMYSSSHWQGSGPDYPVAVAEPGAESALRRLRNEIDTCSFCGVGLGNYSVGDCYVLRRSRRQPNAPTLPGDASSWTDQDLVDWFREL